MTPLCAGEPAPWFSAANGHDHADMLTFDELAGRYIVLFFFGSAARPDVAETLAALSRRDDVFDGERTLLVGISNDPDDFDQARVRPRGPGQLFLLDSSGFAARKYGLADPAKAAIPSAIRPVAFILSPALQIIGTVKLAEPSAFDARVVSLLTERLATPAAAQNAPVLIVPNVFDHGFCRELVDQYEAGGGREIGLIEKDGKIVERTDPKYRKRLDYYISDGLALRRTKELLERRLLPIVYRAFQFPTTRIERYLVGCYDAECGGYFRPHRDNTAPAVAHRRFAVSIILNEDYEGGDLYFPEFGWQTFRTSPGDAIVFSCSLLHEVRPVTHGRRYAFVSFFYDEQSQKMRDAYARTGPHAPR